MSSHTNINIHLGKETPSIKVADGSARSGRYITLDLEYKTGRVVIFLDDIKQLRAIRDQFSESLASLENLFELLPN